MQENEIQVLTDVEIDEVAGASLASSIGYVVGYVLQKSSTYYGTQSPDLIM